MEKMRLSRGAIKGIGSLFVVVVAMIIIVMVFCVRVPEGMVAVVYSPNGGATKVLNSGWHMIKPFEKTQEYPSRITIADTSIAVTTKDGKKITMPARYEMQVDKSKVLTIFKELGSQNIEEIQEGYLYQRLFTASREVISEYTVLDIFGTKAAEASARIKDKMAELSEELGFIVKDVTLGNPEVDEGTQRAIDERVKAAQQLEKLQLDKEIAKAEADRKRIEAQGEADKLIIEAKAKAEANNIISKSLTDKLLKQKELDARLKHGWVTVTGNSTVVTDTTGEVK